MQYPEAPDEWFNRQIRQQDGIFDRASFNLMMSACKKFNTAIDIGAHVGTWSIGMAERFDNVYAIEPTSENFEYLVKNTVDIEKIHVANIALGNKNDFISMEKSGSNSGEYRVSATKGTVHLITLDEWLGLKSNYEVQSVDLIKIDVEGYELFVLQGAEKTIDEHHPVLLIELSHGDHYGHPNKVIQQWVEAKGYKLVGISNKDFVYRVD